MTMVGRKKRNATNRDHFINNNLSNDSRQNALTLDHQNKYGANHSKRFNTRVRNVGSDTEMSGSKTYVRRPQINVANCNYEKRQLPVADDGILQRSDSREGGSASAGSVASAADDEGSPSASGFEGDVDEVNANGFASNASSKQSYVVVESTSSGEKEHADEKNDIGYASEHSVCSSVSSQTEFSVACTEIILAVSRLQPWERAETLAQLVYSLSALEQRFLGSCVEAAVRSNSVHLRQYETLYNDPQAIANCLNYDYQRLLEVAYIIICMLRAGSRQAATQFLEILNRLLTGWSTETSHWSQRERRNALLKLKSIVSAALNHPAVSVENKVHLLEIHEHLSRLHTSFATSMEQQDNSQTSCEGDTTKKGSSIGQSCSPSTSSYVKPTVISSLDVVKVIPGSASEEYEIEVTWSDGARNNVVKTGDQIFDLQARLLDEFPEEARSSSKSNRLIPYLCRKAPESVTNYIRSLPNLPARVLISPVIYNTFCPVQLCRDNAEANSAQTGMSSPRQTLAEKTKQNNISTTEPSLDGVTSNFAHLCVLSHPFPPAVAICPSGNPITSTTPCVPLPSTGLASPGVTQYVSIVPRSVPLRNVASVIPRPIYTIQPHSNSPKPCQNCGGPHPFATCSQSTMLDAVNSGTYNLNYGASDEVKSRVSHPNRILTFPIQHNPVVRQIDSHAVTTNHKNTASGSNTSIMSESLQNIHLKSVPKYAINQTIIEENEISKNSSKPSVSKKNVTKHSSSNRNS